FSMGVGSIDPDAARLIEVTEQSLESAISSLDPTLRLGDVGYAVQACVEAAGYSVVEDYTGHAIGRALPEEPQVATLGRPRRGGKIRVGNVFAIEPMVNAGGPDTVLLDDGWTVVTADGSLSAHVEHTIAVTDDGPQVLTRV